MNKNMKKLMMALMLIGAVCGTANAAAKGGHDVRGKAPIAMKATSKGYAKGYVEHKAHAKNKVHVVKAHHDHKAQVVKHHYKHHDMHHHDVHRHDKRHDVVVVHEDHYDNWALLGATVVGGVIGAIVGSAL